MAGNEKRLLFARLDHQTSEKRSCTCMTASTSIPSPLLFFNLEIWFKENKETQNVLSVCKHQLLFFFFIVHYWYLILAIHMLSFFALSLSLFAEQVWIVFLFLLLSIPDEQHPLGLKCITTNITTKSNKNNSCVFLIRI